jgi:hypothetical protein
MRLGSLVCGLLISIIYLMDFLYLQWGLESRPCREILYIYRCTHIILMRVLLLLCEHIILMRGLILLCLLYVNLLEKPPSLRATDIVLLLFTSNIF